MKNFRGILCNLAYFGLWPFRTIHLECFCTFENKLECFVTLNTISPLWTFREIHLLILFVFVHFGTHWSGCKISIFWYIMVPFMQFDVFSPFYHALEHFVEIQQLVNCFAFENVEQLRRLWYFWVCFHISSHIDAFCKILCIVNFWVFGISPIPLQIWVCFNKFHAICYALMALIFLVQVSTHWTFLFCYAHIWVFRLRVKYMFFASKYVVCTPLRLFLNILHILVDIGAVC